MSCSYKEKVSSLIDGELAPSEARDVERHLFNCVECENLRADFLNLRSQIASFETSLQPTVQNRALKKILSGDLEPHRAPARGLRWGFGTQAVAFATLLIVGAIIGLVVYQTSSTRDSEKQQVAFQGPSPAPESSIQKPSQAESPEASPEPSKEEQPAPSKDHKETTTPKRSTPPRRPPVREPKPGEQFASIPAPLRSADAETMTAIHFEKAERLLLGFKNVRLNEPGAATKVGYERKRAKELVYQNMMLRREADAAGDVQIASLLESLQPILLDIANLPARPDQDSVRVIRERVERKNIVALLRVNHMALAKALD